jgi:hypothetical protein
MLTLAPHEINIANSFLKPLEIDITNIQFINKNNTYYNAKTKEEIKDFLSYVILHYPLTSDIYISKGIKGINITSSFAGVLQINAVCLPENNYETIEIDGISFLNTCFNRHIKNILNAKHIQEDFIDMINVPLYGSYKLRSSSMGNDASVRLLRINGSIDNPTMKSNVLYLQEKPYYIIDLSNLDNFVSDGVITINDKIKEQLQLYKITVDKVFNHLMRVTDNIYILRETDLKLKLEQKDNEEIKATVIKKYNIAKSDKKLVLDYLIDNYKVFYDPIFSNFIENCVGVEKDEIIGDFKSPEALKDYLTAIKMLKI